jgi:hypothetical protein
VQRSGPIENKGQCGIGLLLEVAHDSNAVKVKSVLPGSPAEQSGKIRAGDELHSVRGQVVAGMPLASVFEMVLGDEGSTLELELYHQMEIHFSGPGQQLANASSLQQRLVKVELQRAYPLPMCVKRYKESDATESAVQPGMVEMKLRLHMEFRSVGQEGSTQRQRFINELKQDLADASGADVC